MSIDAMASGPDWVAALASVDAASLTPSAAIDLLQVHQRAVAWLDSMHAQLLVAAAEEKPRVEEFVVEGWFADSDSEYVRTVKVTDAIREEIAAALRWSPGSAQHRIDTARLLAGPLTDIRLALAAGLITSAHVNVMVEQLRRVDTVWQRNEQEVQAFAELAARFQKRVLPVAQRGTVAATRRAAKTAILVLDAAGERTRRQRARERRDVWVSDALDGMSTLVAVLATADAHAILAQVNATAHAAQNAAHDATAGPGACHLGIGEHRAEALAQLVLGCDGAEQAPVRAHVDVVIDLPTLLSLQDDEIDGVARMCGQTVSADDVRALLADPDVRVTMRRLVIDPVTRHLLDHGRHTYTIPDRLRQFITVRDQVCRFPGCHRAAKNCQIDHAVPWDDGGDTTPANLGALCVRHHQLKTHTGWNITHSDTAGACTWVSPFGRTYQHEPEPVIDPALQPAGQGIPTDPDPPPF